MPEQGVMLNGSFGNGWEIARMACYDPFAMREWMQQMGLRLAGPVALGLILGLIGPFGTFALLPVLPRLGYWLAVVALNWLLCDIAVRRVDALTPDSLAMRRVVVPLAGAALVSLPATGVVALANGLSGIGWPDNLLALYWQVALLLCAVALPVYTLAELREAKETAEMLARDTPVPDAGIIDAPTTETGMAQTGTTKTGTMEPGLALFMARLPRPLDGQLLCLAMQDHYLCVHTTAGNALILCRMEDAARELAGLGHRVHRSWWVATEAVDRVEREGQRLSIRLIDDRRVPVGRTFRDALKHAGWMDGANPRIERA